MSIAEAEQGFHIGYYSFLDKNRDIRFDYFEKSYHLIDPIKDDEYVKMIARFSEGFYTVETNEGAIMINDLRFGRVIDWNTGKGEFVFAYHIANPEANQDKLEITQVWASVDSLWKTMLGLFRRILGINHGAR